MAEYLSQGAFQPSIPSYLLTEKDLKMFRAFGLTMTPDREDSLLLFSDDWCTAGYAKDEDGNENELSEDDLFSCFQEIIRRSNGELPWISQETAYTCTESKADGYGGSAVFVTADEVRSFSTSSWLERRIHELETGEKESQCRTSTMKTGCQPGLGQNTDYPANEERAHRINPVMRAYCLALEGRGFNGDEDDVKDLLVDLMHFCVQMEIDFEGNLRVARDNFHCERTEKVDIPCPV